MAVSTRTFRQFAKIFQDQENFGLDRLAGLGDHVAAFRANLDFQIREDRSSGDASSLNADDRNGGEPQMSQAVPGDGPVQIATTLSLAQVAIVQFNSDDADDPHIAGVQNMTRDSISFILLAPAGSGTIIYFTDRSWNGTVLGAAGGGDGTYAWTTGADLAAGTVITISEAELTAAGIELVDTGEVIYVFQGPNDSTPTTFLHAVEYGDLNDTFTGSLLNTGLVAGTSALAIAEDNGSFGERFWNTQTATFFQNVNSHLNWHTNENSPQTNHVEGTNLHVAPDVQLWIAGISGGHGIMSVSGDASQNGGLGYNVQTHFQNTANDGNGLTTTSRFWSPTHILFDTVEGKFFIVDSSGTNDRILQGNISDMLNNPGTEPPMTILYSEQPAVSDGSGITGMVLDIVNNHVYFTRNNDLMRVNFDTANQPGIVLADLGNNPNTGATFFANEIALDLANGRAFVMSTESFSDFVGNPPVLVTALRHNTILRIDNIASSDTGIGNNTVTRLTFTNFFENSGLELGGPPEPQNFEDTLGRITSLDINTLTGEIWFTTRIAATNGAAGIYRATMSGNNLTVTQIHSQVNAPFANEYIHVDEETGRYYVTRYQGSASSNHTVHTGMLNAAANTAPTLFATVGNINDMSPKDLTVESAPTLTGSGNGGLAVTEASSAPNSGATAKVTLYGVLTASDIDTSSGDELAGAQVRISTNFVRETSSTATGHTATQDFLTINNLESGTIAGSGITFSYNQATGVLTLSGAATVTEYAAALQLVQFHTSGDNVTNDGNATSRTVSVSVFDGLLYSDEIHATVSVTGINDAPVNTPGAAMNFSEDTTGAAGPPAVNAITGISIADADADATTEIFIVTLSVVSGILNIRTDVTGGLGAGDVTGNGTGTLVLTGTQTEINNTLAAVNGSAQPNGLLYTPNANFNGADTLTIVTNDQGNNGTEPGNSGDSDDERDTDTKTLNIADVNDAPTVIDATQDSPTILEDTPMQQSGTPPPPVAPTVGTLFAASFSDATDIQNVPGNATGSAGDTFAGIAIVADGSAPATGQWEYWSGAAWTDIGAASQGAARTFTAGTQIRFNPAPNFNGPAPTLTVHLIESGGPAITNNGTVNLTPAGTATGGTTVYSSGTVVLSQTITPVNDAPVNTVGGTLTVAEDSGATAVTGMSISDVDANPATDVFTVTLDVLHGTLNLSIVVPGGVTAATGNGTATVTFTGTINQINATLAAAGGLTYTPTGDYNGSDRVQITTNDGGATGLDPGGPSPTSEQDIDSKTINVTAVNDPVTGTAPASATLDEDSINFAISGMSISDIDATLAPAGIYVVTLSSTNGTMTMSTLTNLTFSAGDGTADATMTFRGTLADINTALATASYTPTAHYNGSATITLAVTDTFGGTVATGTGAATSDNDVISVTVTAVNDPVGTNAPPTATIDEDAVNAAITGLSISDVDAALAPAGVYQVTLSSTAGTMTLATLAGLTFDAGDGTGDSTMTFHGTLADINTALATATYTPPANYNGPAQITLSATDEYGAVVATGTGAATNDSDVINVTVNAVNDTPVVSLAATGSSTEQVAGAVDPTATISDIDLDARNGGNGDYGLATLTIANNGGNDVNDLFAIGTSGAFTVNGSNLEAPGNLVFATFAGGNGTPLIITFTSSGTAATTALVNAVAKAIQYTYTGDIPPPAGIDIAISLHDGAPGNAGQGSIAGHPPTGSDIIHLSITNTPENQPPTLDLDGDTGGTGYTAAFTEGGAAVLITDTDVAIADADAGDMIEGATITINSPLAGDVLTLGAQGGFIINGSGTGTITIAGTGTAAQYEAMLELVTFSTSSEDPGASRTITTTVTDGTDNSNAAVTTINITQINDEPTLTATGVSPTFTEGGAGADLFSTVSAMTIEAGQSFTSLTLTISNVTDGADEILAIDGTSIALTNGNSVVSTHGTVTVALSLGTATVTFTSAGVTPAELQTLIDNLSYGNGGQNPTDADRVVTIIQVTDSGSNVSPNDNTTTLSIVSTVNVNPVNDAPVNAVPTAQTIDEDAAVTFSSGGGNPITVSDVDLAPGNVTVTLSIADGSLVPVSGGGAVIGNSGTNNVTITGTLAQVNAALEGLVYTPPAHANGSRTLTVTTSDNGNSGGPAQQDVDTVTINITAQNDTPVVAIATTVAAVEQTAVTLDAAATVSDIDLDARNGGNGDYGGALMTIQRQSGADAQDLFAITGGAGFTVSGNQLLSGALEFATIETVSPGLFRVNFTSAQTAATTALVNAVARAIQYTNSSDTPPASVDLILALLDGSPGGGQGGGPNGFVGADTITVTIGAVNDAPLTTAPASASGNEDTAIAISGINVSDSDVGGGTLTVTLAIADGVLNLTSTAGLVATGVGTNSVSLTGTAANLNASLAGLTYTPPLHANGSRALTVGTSDNGNTGTPGPQTDTDMVAITINSVNDAPSGTTGSVSGSEDDPLVFTADDFGFSDPADGNTLLAVRIATLPGVGQLRLNGVAVNAGDFIPVAQINAGQLTFHPVADQFGNNYASFTFQVQDNGGVLLGGVDLDQSPNTMTINIAPDNLPPVVDLDGATGGVNYTTTFVEDGAAVAIGSGVIVSDPDVGLGDMIESATITLTDRVAGDSLTITGVLPPGFLAVTTPSAGAITIQITGQGTGAQYQALIESIQYATTSQDPTVGGTDLARTITVTVNDGTISSAVATTIVNVTAIDDAPVAQPDVFVITESGTIVGGNLFANNGSGADSDPDGPPLAISAVGGGPGANVGSQFTLNSGALLTVNANGTFNYNPNGVFLPTPTAGSGASNTPGHDSFTYTLAGGNTVTVSITLTGLDTNDTLLGTAGADILIGGNGNDTYFIENAGDQAIEAVGQGFDAVYTSVSYTLAAGTEIEWLTTAATYGTGAINLTGNEFANVLIGNDGANTLSGGGGADVHVGYGGNDSYFVESSADLVVEAAAGGFDAIYTSVSYTLAAGAEVEWLAADAVYGTAAIDLTGNEFANTILGNQGANLLNGAGGADALVGYGGNDTYLVDNASDLIIEAAGAGFDAVYTSISYTLSAGAEVEWLSTDATYGTAAINLTGNELANIILGNQGNNIITDGGGADLLVGYGGNDTYYVSSASAQVLESAGGGNDAVYASASFTLGAGQEIEFLSASNFSATTALNLTGNELANTIYGNDGANVLDGKGGNDSLVGLAGADTFAFTTALGAANVDLVFGFEHNIDKIALDDAVFTQIGGLGALNANAFVVGGAAADSTDRIIYNSATGQLFYDADGNGGGAAVQFATLSPGLSLTASDFQVI